MITKSIRVFSCDLQIPPSAKDLSQNDLDRARRLVEELSLDDFGHYDVVCFQGLYNKEVEFSLQNMFQEEKRFKYQHFVTNVGGHLFSQNSGLFVASRFPVKGHHFIPFSNTTSHTREYLANKGLLICALDLGDYGEFLLLNTSLHETSWEIRHKQIQEIRNMLFLDKEFIRQGNLLVGNFFTDTQEEGHYKQMLNELVRPADLFSLKYYTPNHTSMPRAITWDMDNNHLAAGMKDSHLPTKGRSCYALAWPTPKQNIHKCTIRTSGKGYWSRCSPHYGMAIEIIIAPSRDLTSRKYSIL